MLTTPENSSAWLDGLVALAQSRIITEVVELTPSRARVLLARNPKNRTLSSDTVEKYGRDIANGKWSLNGEPIIVSKDGLLNDGQHRCEAVIATGVSINVVIVVGTERDSRYTIDQGKTRQAGDYLSMDGHSHAFQLSATAGFVWQYQQRGMISSQTHFRPTKSEILEIVAEFPGIAKSVDATPTKGANVVGGQSVLAFCHFVFSRKAPLDAVDDFMLKLRTGEDLRSNDPILYIRNRFIRERGRLKVNEKAELIFRAFNATRRGDFTNKFLVMGGVLTPVER